jgi:hypothetical protein
MMIRRLRFGQLGCFACVAALVVVAGAGCKPTQNSQKAYGGTVPPQRDAAPVLRAPVVKPAEPTAVVEHRQEIPPNDKTRKCEEICRIPAPLHCSHQDGCVNGCESMATGIICKAEIRRMYDCLLRQPAENWECDENGVGAIRDPFCDREQAAAVKCLEANVGKM